MSESREKELIEKWRKLTVEEQQKVVKFMESIEEKKSTKMGKKLRPWGLCEGEFEVPDDFDEPLSVSG